MNTKDLKVTTRSNQHVSNVINNVDNCARPMPDSNGRILEGKLENIKNNNILKIGNKNKKDKSSSRLDGSSNEPKPNKSHFSKSKSKVKFFGKITVNLKSKDTTLDATSSISRETKPTSFKSSHSYFQENQETINYESKDYDEDGNSLYCEEDLIKEDFEINDNDEDNGELNKDREILPKPNEDQDQESEIIEKDMNQSDDIHKVFITLNSDSKIKTNNIFQENKNISEDLPKRNNSFDDLEQRNRISLTDYNDPLTEEEIMQRTTECDDFTNNHKEMTEYHMIYNWNTIIDKRDEKSLSKCDGRLLKEVKDLSEGGNNCLFYYQDNLKKENLVLKEEVHNEEEIITGESAKVENISLTNIETVIANHDEIHERITEEIKDTGICSSKTEIDAINLNTNKPSTLAQYVQQENEDNGEINLNVFRANGKINVKEESFGAEEIKEKTLSSNVMNETEDIYDDDEEDESNVVNKQAGDNLTDENNLIEKKQTEAKILGLKRKDNYFQRQWKNLHNKPNMSNIDIKNKLHNTKNISSEISNRSSTTNDDIYDDDDFVAREDIQDTDQIDDAHNGEAEKGKTCEDKDKESKKCSINKDAIRDTDDEDQPRNEERNDKIKGIITSSNTTEKVEIDKHKNKPSILNQSLKYMGKQMRSLEKTHKLLKNNIIEKVNIFRQTLSRSGNNSHAINNDVYDDDATPDQMDECNNHNIDQDDIYDEDEIMEDEDLRVNGTKIAFDKNHKVDNECVKNESDADVIPENKNEDIIIKCLDGIDSPNDLNQVRENDELNDKGTSDCEGKGKDKQISSILINEFEETYDDEEDTEAYLLNVSNDDELPNITNIIEKHQNETGDCVGKRKNNHLKRQWKSLHHKQKDLNIDIKKRLHSTKKMLSKSMNRSSTKKDDVYDDDDIVVEENSKKTNVKYNINNVKDDRKNVILCKEKDIENSKSLINIDIITGTDNNDQHENEEENDKIKDISISSHTTEKDKVNKNKNKSSILNQQLKYVGKQMRSLEKKQMLITNNITEKLNIFRKTSSKSGDNSNDINNKLHDEDVDHDQVNDPNSPKIDQDDIYDDDDETADQDLETLEKNHEVIPGNKNNNVNDKGLDGIDSGEAVNQIKDNDGLEDKGKSLCEGKCNEKQISSNLVNDSEEIYDDEEDEEAYPANATNDDESPNVTDIIEKSQKETKEPGIERKNNHLKRQWKMLYNKQKNSKLDIKMKLDNAKKILSKSKNRSSTMKEEMYDDDDGVVAEENVKNANPKDDINNVENDKGKICKAKDKENHKIKDISISSNTTKKLGVDKHRTIPSILNQSFKYMEKQIKRLDAKKILVKNNITGKLNIFKQTSPKSRDNLNAINNELYDDDAAPDQMNDCQSPNIDQDDIYDEDDVTAGQDLAVNSTNEIVEENHEDDNENAPNICASHGIIKDEKDGINNKTIGIEKDNKIEAITDVHYVDPNRTKERHQMNDEGKSISEKERKETQLCVNVIDESEEIYDDEEELDECIVDETNDNDSINEKEMIEKTQKETKDFGLKRKDNYFQRHWKNMHNKSNMLKVTKEKKSYKTRGVLSKPTNRCSTTNDDTYDDDDFIARENDKDANQNDCINNAEEENRNICKDKDEKSKNAFIITDVTADIYDDDQQENEEVNDIIKDISTSSHTTKKVEVDKHKNKPSILSQSLKYVGKQMRSLEKTQKLLKHNITEKVNVFRQTSSKSGDNSNAINNDVYDDDADPDQMDECNSPNIDQDDIYDEDEIVEDENLKVNSTNKAGHENHKSVQNKSDANKITDNEKESIVGKGLDGLGSGKAPNQAKENNELNIKGKSFYDVKCKEKQTHFNLINGSEEIYDDEEDEACVVNTKIDDDKKNVTNIIEKKQNETKDFASKPNNNYFQKGWKNLQNKQKDLKTKRKLHALAVIQSKPKEGNDNVYDDDDNVSQNSLGSSIIPTSLQSDECHKRKEDLTRSTDNSETLIQSEDHASHNTISHNERLFSVSANNSQQKPRETIFYENVYEEEPLDPDSDIEIIHLDIKLKELSSQSHKNKDSNNKSLLNTTNSKDLETNFCGKEQELENIPKSNANATPSFQHNPKDLEPCQQRSDHRTTRTVDNHSECDTTTEKPMEKAKLNEDESEDE